MSGRVHWVNECVWVCSHTFKNKQILLALLKADDVNPFADHETFPFEVLSEMTWQPLTKTYWSVCFHLSLWMNSQSSSVTLHPAAQHLAWFGSLLYFTFFFSSTFKVVFIGYNKTYMHAGRRLVSWNNRRGSQRCCLRQALTVRDTSICLCTHAGELHSSQKWAELILNIM